MPEQFLHGAQVVEIEDGPRPIRTVNSAIIGFVGTAPDAAAAAAASLVFGSGTSALTVTAATAGIEGNKISVRLKNPGANSATLSVALVGTAITVNLATDNAGVITSTAALIKTALDANTAIAALVDVVSGGTGIVKSTATTFLSGGLDAACPLNTPTLCANNAALIARLGETGTLPVGMADIQRQTGAVVVMVRAEVGEDDEETAENIIAAIAKLLEAESTLGLVPRILIAPEFSATKEVADELVSVAGKLRAFVFADGPNTTDAAALNYQSQFGSARIVVVDPYCIRLNVEHPTSAAAAGATAKRDYENGFWWSPSNNELLGFSKTSRPIPYRLSDPTCEANLLNEGGVMTVVRNSGLKLWGNRTASDDMQFAFISVRRTADMIQDSILRAHAYAVDRPITPFFLQDVAESVNAYIASLVALGAILGGECWPDPDLNTPANITQGKVYFNFKFSPVYPAESITFRSMITDQYLSELTA